MQKKNNSSIAMVGVFLMISTLLLGCIQPPYNAEAKELPKFTSCNAIKESFESSTANRGFGIVGIAQNALTTGLPASAESTDSGSKATSYSETNIQVQGVDEADIVKTDGEFIYSVSNGRLHISKAFPVEIAELLSSTKLGDVRPSEIFIHNNSLLVFGASSEVFTTSQNEGNEARQVEAGQSEILGQIQTTNSIETSFARKNETISFTSIAIDSYPRYFSKQLAVVLLFDISDKTHPVLEKSLEFEGSYLTSRKIQDKVYFVINSYPNYYALQETETDSQIVPSFREIIGAELIEQEIVSVELEPIAPCYEISYFPPVQAQSFITIGSLSMNNFDGEIQKQTIVGSGQNVYASENNLYVAETQHNFGIPIQTLVRTAVQTVAQPLIDVAKESNESVDSIPIPEPSPEENITKTIVHKFALNNGIINYLGNFSAKGTILNQFSMDEFDNHFRIATTIQRWGSWNSETGSRNLSTNNVYVFNENLEQVGEIEGIAPGETIYSSRFVGERAYLVTFKKVDPFFVIDLSNPNHPKILGALKIPGFSDYLHPIDDTHVIGIGKDTIESKSGDFAWYQGIKMAVFDATNPENPIELHKILIGDRGTDSFALHDHKAFLYDKEKHLLVLPIALYEIPDSVKEEFAIQPVNWPAYGSFVFQGAYVFDLTLENGFDLRGTITHQSQEELGKLGSYYYGYGKEVKRSLYIEDVLFTLSDGLIKASNLNDLSFLTQIELPGSKN